MVPRKTKSLTQVKDGIVHSRDSRVCWGLGILGHVCHLSCGNGSIDMGNAMHEEFASVSGYILLRIVLNW